MKRLYYQTYDVTALLRAGENEVITTLADGWWIGRIGLSGDSCQYGDRLGFLMQLEWTETGGEARTLCSDASFQSRRSYIDYADLFIGERHDYSASPEPWGPVTVADYATANLVAQPTAPVVEWERLDALKVFESPAGELIADFGVCLAGVVEITVRAPQGTEVVLDFSEVLDEAGNFYRNIMGRNKDQRDVFVCGGGETIFRPRFTYHGFRYVRIAGVKREQVVSVRACALGTELASTGHFSCSDERLNVLQRNIRQSERSNMFSVPTDCPQREKMGWTGDIMVFAKTGCFNYDLHNFLAGWLGNVRAEQCEDGEVPNVVPTYPAQDRMERAMKGYNTSAAWGDACVLVPHDLYRCYGDRRVLRDNLAMMERWLDFIAKAAAQEPEGFEQLTPAQQARNQYLWNKGQHFGDWLTPSFAGSHEGVMAGMAATREVVASCQYAITVRAFVAVLDCSAEGGAGRGVGAQAGSLREPAGEDQAGGARGVRLRRRRRARRPHGSVRHGASCGHRGGGAGRAGGREAGAVGRAERLPAGHGLCLHAASAGRAHPAWPQGRGLPAAVPDREPLVALHGRQRRDEHLGELGGHHSRRQGHPVFFRPLRPGQRGRLDLSQRRRHPDGRDRDTSTSSSAPT